MFPNKTRTVEDAKSEKAAKVRDLSKGSPKNTSRGRETPVWINPFHSEGEAGVGAGHHREQHPCNNSLKGDKNDRAKWAKLSGRDGIELNLQEKNIFFTLMQNAH